MQRFPCPWCGERPETEFRYAGDADRPRPERDCDDAPWSQYLHFRANARGPSRELWVHSAGCGRWLVLERDTQSHDVLGSEAMNP